MFRTDVNAAWVYEITFIIFASVDWEGHRMSEIIWSTYFLYIILNCKLIVFIIGPACL